MMGLKLLSLGRGASRVRWELIELLQSMIERTLPPWYPRKGRLAHRETSHNSPT